MPGGWGRGEGWAGGKSRHTTAPPLPNRGGERLALVPPQRSGGAPPPATARPGTGLGGRAPRSGTPPPHAAGRFRSDASGGGTGAAARAARAAARTASKEDILRMTPFSYTVCMTLPGAAISSSPSVTVR